MNNYLVIVGRTDIEKDALSLRTKLKRDYQSAWILYIVDGNQEIYNR